MLLMMHVEKDFAQKSAEQSELAEPLIPPVEWCTRDTGDESDHVIVIYDCDRFVKDLLPMFEFPSTSPASFVRKMFRWGFRQVSEMYEVANQRQSNRPRSTYMYQCEHFRKGMVFILWALFPTSAITLPEFC
jgi:HSF-type DNA-binding